MPEGDRTSLEAAEAAGFGYAVDVDLQDKQPSLPVAEPDWVTATATGMHLAHVPGSRRRLQFSSRNRCAIGSSWARRVSSSRLSTSGCTAPR